MCMGKPDTPAPVSRQDVKLPQGDEMTNPNKTGRRRLALAGLVTSATGAMGNANVGKATLG